MTTQHECRIAAVELLGECAAAISAATDERAAAAAGVTEADVTRAAFWLTQAELLGLRDFGIDMLVRDIERMPAVASESGAAETTAPAPAGRPLTALDATGIPGPLALAVAARRASEAATQHGIGVAGIRNVGALGILGFAARYLADADAVALVAAQAPAIVAPWGGTQPAIGTNPLAVAAPRADAAPLVADFATAPLTLAELRERRASGTELPAGVALDAAGAPTLDAASVSAILPESLVGSLGGLLVELLAGVAVGGRAPAGAPASGRGALVLALDPAAAGGVTAGQDTTQLAADWRAAGGHVPGRFDQLPTAPEDLRGEVVVDAERYAALLSLAGRSAQ